MRTPCSERQPSVVRLELVAAFDDRRVDDRAHAVLFRLEDEEATQDADLGRCEPDALCVVHQADHAVDEAAEVVVEIRDLVRRQAQRRVAVLADLSERQPAARLDLGVVLVVVLAVVVVVLVVMIGVVLMVVIVGHSRCSVVSARQGTASGSTGRPAARGDRACRRP